jgi:hypothetical protein
MAPSTAKVVSAHACHVTAAQTSDAASAETAEVASAKAAAHVAPTKAAHVASTKAAAHVASATATAAAGLGISGKKAAGKHCTCQNHHHSSSHDILLLESAGPSATGSRQPVACAKGKRQRRDELEMEMIVCPLY